MAVWITRNNQVSIRIIKKTVGGKVFLEIRYFFKKGDYWFPLKKGIMIPESLFQDFLLAITSVLENPPEEDPKATGNIEELLNIKDGEERKK